ncbi:type I secretion system permease/ATPase [Desulfovibrio sp. OttesenSCG-928-F07]|nr:type I secretion system permease/ATPase [Desulfovibrio sp. OttesenSCG-928-F07]
MAAARQQAAKSGIDASLVTDENSNNKVGLSAEAPFAPREGGNKSGEDLSESWIVEPSPADIEYNSPLLLCLTMMAKREGKPISTSVIAATLPAGPSSMRPSVILRAARAAGIDAAISAKPKLEQISDLTLPCVLMLQNSNACILTAQDEETVTVIMPEQGTFERKIPRAALEKEYIGYAIFVKVAAKLDARASRIKLIDHSRWFWGTLASFGSIYRHVFAASLITNLLALSAPLFTMNVYDRVVPNGTNALETLWTLGIGIFIAYLFDFLLKNLRGYFVDVAGRNADIIMAGKLMQHVLALRLDHKPDSTGSLANNLREFESLRDFFSSSTMMTLVDLPFLLVFLGVIALIGGPIVIVPLLAIPIVLLMGFIMQLPMQQVSEQGFKENMQKNALLVEIINGLETVKTSMAEGRMQSTWDKVVSLSAISSANSKRMTTLSTSGTMLLTQLVSVGMIIVGVYLNIDGRISMGGIIAANMLSGRAMAPLSQLSGMFARLQQSRMALKALNQLMELPTENVSGDSYVEFGELEPSLQLEGVYFKYPNSERFALENINLNIRPGEKVGIIGSMGSGKSSFGRLCVGLYQPTEGAVKMGGVDIRQLDTTTLRYRFGYLSQDNYLFYGSVRDNIAFGAVNVDDRMILRAANIAGVSDFVRSNPAGFGMQVGERGMSLSGGQRQSVAIARALLRDPDILIFDEPSSNMDNSSEARLKMRLAETITDKTFILITHRLSLLDLVDRLIIMDNGRVFADGPKAEVLNFLRQKQMRTGQPQKANANAR